MKKFSDTRKAQKRKPQLRFSFLFLISVFLQSMAGTALPLFGTLLGVRAADTLLPAPLGKNDIKDRPADKEKDRAKRQIIYKAHDFASTAERAFLFRISAVISAAIPRTMAQPTIGIQTAPNEPPVKRVPKKNTRKPTV